jgi:hypothetical protein
MAATNYSDLDSVLANFVFQCEVNAALVPFAAYVDAYRVLNSGFLSAPLSDDDLNRMLRLLTGCTVALDPDINCYPRGEVDTICFDLNGDPVP